MAKVKVEDGESIEAALRRFKKEVLKAGIIQEIKKRENYENPKLKKRKKKEEGRIRATFKNRRRNKK